MTLETLRKANELEAELYKIDKFLDAVKRNSLIRFFKKKTGIAVTVSDYMRETQLYELTQEQREKFIKMLEEEYEEKIEELNQLN